VKALIAVLFPTWHRPYILAIEVSLPHHVVRFWCYILPGNLSNPLEKRPLALLIGGPPIQMQRRRRNGPRLQRSFAFRKHLRVFELLGFQSCGWFYRFWDWTEYESAKNGLPDVFQAQTFTFKLPGREESTIDNPLASFDFGSSHPDGFENFIWKTPLATQAVSFFKDWQRTYRWPTSKLHPTDDYVKIKGLSCLPPNMLFLV
jgi:hypothetical protein